MTPSCRERAAKAPETGAYSLFGARVGGGGACLGLASA
jgi:hypothetical protein